jgi:DNA-binding SARP family transcriptional activator
MPEESLFETTLQESITLETSGELLLSLEQAQMALHEAEEIQSQEFILKANARLSWLLMSLGRYGDATNHADYVLARSQATPEAVDAMIVKATALSETNQLVQAEPLLQRAVDISRFIQYKTGLYRALHNLANSVYIIRGKFSLALATMEEAQQIATDVGEHHWGLPTLRGYIYQITGDRIRLRQALDELVHLARPGTRIAGVYYYLWSRLALDEGDLAQAEEYLQLSLRIATQTGIPHLQVWVRMANSNYFRAKIESSVAQGWAENAVLHAIQTGSDHLLGQALIEQAQVEWLQGDLHRTEQLLLEAIQKLEKIRADYELAVAAILLTCLYLETDDQRLESMWLKTARQLIHGGYSFILERERSRAYPLIANFLRSKNPEARSAAEMLLNSVERLTPPPIKVKGFGQFIVWVGNRQIPDAAWNRRKSGELFRYLLLHRGHSASREEVLEEFWSENDPETAQDLLHQSTSTIRRILEPDLPEKFPSRYLRVEGERIFLLLPPGSYLDFEQFEAQVPLAIQSGKPQGLQRVLGLYLGDLFPMDQYSNWSSRKRTQLSETYILGMLALCQMWINLGAYQQVIYGIRQIIDQDPWNEDAVFLGMQASVRMGDKPKAVRLFLELEQRLKTDLELTPRLELITYLHEIREGTAM